MALTIRVQINGEPREVPAGLNIQELLNHLGLMANRLAVEKNSKIVTRTEWEATQVAEGDRFEIVHLVGGG